MTMTETKPAAKIEVATTIERRPCRPDPVAMVEELRVATIAHDLRQAPTIVRASAQLPRRHAQGADAGSAPWLDRSLTQIEAAGLWMEQLIDEIVEFARIRAGTSLLLSRHQTDLAVLAARVVADAHATGDRHGAPTASVN